MREAYQLMDASAPAVLDPTASAGDGTAADVKSNVDTATITLVDLAGTWRERKSGAMGGGVEGGGGAALGICCFGFELGSAHSGLISSRLIGCRS